MSDWTYCELVSRINGEAIRVLEYNQEEGVYREKIYDARDGLEDVSGEVYE